MTTNGIVVMVLVLVWQIGAFGYLASLAMKKDSDAREEDLNESVITT